MGYPTKVQLIKRKASEQWYVNFPAVLAQAMEFEKGETVEWTIKDRYALTLQRREASDKHARKKNARAGAGDRSPLDGMHGRLPATSNVETGQTTGAQSTRLFRPTHRGRADLCGGTPSRRLVSGLPPVRARQVGCGRSLRTCGARYAAHAA